MQVPDFVHTDLRALGFDVPSQMLDQLSRYLDLLLDANRAVNLTAVRDRDEAWRRLIIDSLTVLPGLDELEEHATIIDIGSGGGLPGIPIAIARPDLRVTLLDATGKKVRFLEKCVDELTLANAAAIQDRAEALGHLPQHRQRYDVAVSRAIGSMSAVLEYSLPLVKVGGRVLAMKGPRAEQELEDAADALTQLGAGDLHVFDAYPDGFDNQLVIIAVTKDRPTPKQYPRAPGVPQSAPL